MNVAQVSVAGARSCPVAALGLWEKQASSGKCHCWFPSPGKERTSVASPLIPKHFSPGCFVINIPKGAEDLIKSLLLKGRLSDVCLQIPGSQQRLCELRLVLLARAGLGAGLPLLMGSTTFLSLNRPRRNMAGI